MMFNTLPKKSLIVPDIMQISNAPLSQRLKPVFLRKLVGIYNSKRFPYDVLVVVNIFG